ncbi:hypothetical protein BH24PSE2_BH24PSE2_07060 [soil metagenome]
MKKELAIAIGMALAGTACAGEESEYTAGTSMEAGATQVKTFEELDADQDMRLSKDEATESKSIDEESFAQADLNQDDYLSRTEFDTAKGGSQSWGTSGSATAKSFEELDADRDSRLSKDEATESEIIDEETFAQADMNQDDYLSRTEFDTAKSGSQSWSPSGSSMAKSFEELDADRDSRLSKDEATESKILDEQKFAEADTNQDDYLSRTEYDSVKSQVSSGSSMAKSFRELDADQNSKLSKDEATKSQLIDEESFALADLDQDDQLSQTEYEMAKSGSQSWSPSGSSVAKSFEELDADQDSKLSKDEATESMIIDEEAFAQADLDQDDHLSRTEYDSVKSQISSGSSMAMNFEDLDVNQDSLISEQEATDSQVLDSESFARADTNQDGYLSQTEFKARSSDPTGADIEIETETEIDETS